MSGASTMDYFSRIASTYDRINRLMSLGLDKRWRRRLVTAMPAAAAPRVLDLCAGTLECTLEVFRRFPRVSVTAVDCSEPMLKLGLKKIPPEFLDRLVLHSSDVLEINLPPESFDVILCAWGVRNVANVDMLLERARKWLAPGGIFLTLDLFRPSSLFSRAVCAGVFRTVVPFLGGWFSRDKEAYRYLAASVRNFDSIGEYQRRLERHGFCVGSVQRFACGLIGLITCYVTSSDRSSRRTTPQETPP